MLRISNLNAYYDTSHIVRDFSLEVEEGETLCVLGRNGVGKTTLLKSLMGIEVKTSGSIQMNLLEMTNMPTFKRARHGIGYVPQGRGIVPGLTVNENIMLGCNARSDGNTTVPDLVWELFPFLKEHAGRRGTNLSGGQQQQLAIARALATDPKVLLLDEPTEGIQPSIVQDVEKAIISLNRDHGLTVILVEQKVTFARSAAHRYIIMETGRVVASGSAEALSDDIIHTHMGL